VPALLEVVLLPVHPALADGATESVSALPGVAAPARARQLQMGGGGTQRSNQVCDVSCKSRQLGFRFEKIRSVGLGGQSRDRF
jgi:hypothetical protein